MKDYKKSSNQRRNERIRLSSKKIDPNLKLETWLALPIDENNQINFDSIPKAEVKLRKFEAEHTNNFLELNNQPTRYARKSEWLRNKWEKKLKE